MDATLKQLTRVMKYNELYFGNNLVLFKDGQGKVYGRILNQNTKQLQLQ